MIVQHITIVRGKSYVRTLKFRRDGGAIPLTGAKIWFMAKDAVTDPDAQAKISLSSDAGDITIETPAADGIATLNISPAKTEGLPNVDAVFEYRIQLLEADGRKTEPAGGRCTMKAEGVIDP